MQRSLFPNTNFSLDRPVNVACIPLRSPFRYPGGKTWLVPHIRRWLSKPGRIQNFFEPFTGGGIISLTVAFENLAEHVTMIELDDQVAAVWHTILQDDGGPEWLIRNIMDFEVTHESVMGVINVEQVGTRQKAFQTILKNRTYRGGILAKGSAPVKKGENGKGISSRWYPETLARRIHDIARIKNKITFIEGDGLSYMETYGWRPDSAWFIDPPYTASQKKAGSRLYTHSTIDHVLLFDLSLNLSGDFLMTYDNADEIKQLAHHRQFSMRTVAMKNTHNAEMTELLIGRDLSWI